MGRVSTCLLVVPVICVQEEAQPLPSVSFQARWLEACPKGCWAMARVWWPGWGSATLLPFQVSAESSALFSGLQDGLAGDYPSAFGQW